MLLARRGLLRFTRNLRRVVAALPVAEVFPHHRQHLIVLHVADDDDGDILRAIVTLVELQAVLVLVRHVLDVFDEAHRGVFVGVLLESRRAQDFKNLLRRIRAVLIKLAEHGLRLRLVSVGRILEMLEIISVEFHDLVEVFFGEDFVKDGAVVRRVGVIFRTGAFQNRIALFRRVVLAAAKHQVLEEVRVAALARLDLIARACANDRIDRDEIRKVRRDGNQVQPVRQFVNRVLVRKNFLFLRRRLRLWLRLWPTTLRDAGAGQAQQERDDD